MGSNSGDSLFYCSMDKPQTEKDLHSFFISRQLQDIYFFQFSVPSSLEQSQTCAMQIRVLGYKIHFKLFVKFQFQTKGALVIFRKFTDLTSISLQQNISMTPALLPAILVVGIMPPPTVKSFNERGHFNRPSLSFCPTQNYALASRLFQKGHWND